MAQNEDVYVTEDKQNREAFEQLCCGRIVRSVPGLFEIVWSRIFDIYSIRRPSGKIKIVTTEAQKAQRIYFLCGE